MIKLSIGIPVYNQVETIAQTIDSILNQTIKPYEIVVCDNHSKDGTSEIIDLYKDKVKVVRPPVHLRMAANWNYCVHSCSGDWVGLCSGDDILLPNYYKTMTNEIEKFPNGIFFMGGWINNLLDKGIIETRYLMSMRKVTSYPATVKMLMNAPKASFAAFCFNKEIFTTIGGYDERFYFVQDWILQFDMAFKGDFIRVDELIAEYRITNRDELDKNRLIFFINDFIQFLIIKIPTVPNVISKRYVNKVQKTIMRRIFLKIQDMDYKTNELPLDLIKKISSEISMHDELEHFLKYRIVKSNNNFFKKFFIKLCRNILAIRKKNL